MTITWREGTLVLRVPQSSRDGSRAVADDLVHWIELNIWSFHAVLPGQKTATILFTVQAGAILSGSFVWSLCRHLASHEHHNWSAHCNLIPTEFIWDISLCVLGAGACWVWREQTAQASPGRSRATWTAEMVVDPKSPSSLVSRLWVSRQPKMESGSMWKSGGVSPSHTEWGCLRARRSPAAWEGKDAEPLTGDWQGKVCWRTVKQSLFSLQIWCWEGQVSVQDKKETLF